MKDRYVLLTGSINNAGDFLIKHRAKQLLARLRPDRELVDFNRWEPFNDERLSIVNDSRALILCGGPALQKHMRPEIYPMVGDLDTIRIPVIMMGIGWKSMQGDWPATSHYSLTGPSLELLKKIDRSGYISGVRDYHTLNTLFRHGVTNVSMTGCPALYSLDHIGHPVEYPKEIRTVSFSMGVSFVQSRSMEALIKKLILTAGKMFKNTDYRVIFHHSTDSEAYSRVYNASPRFIHKHRQFIGWLDDNSIAHEDISGSAESLMTHYARCDLHIGFRVHAHIFMNSISKPSVLLNEDGRGKALSGVIGGMSFDAYRHYNERRLLILLRRLGIYLDPYTADSACDGDLESNLRYEIARGYPRIAHTRKSIDDHYRLMTQFIRQLP